MTKKLQSQFDNNQLARHQSQQIIQVKNNQENLNIRPQLFKRISMNLVNPIKETQIELVLKKLSENELIVPEKDLRKYKNSIQLQGGAKEENQQILKNLFIGSNPGLFYSHQSGFDSLSSKQVSQHFSIQNQQKISQNQQQNQQQTEKQQEKSQDTIIDITTAKQTDQITFFQSNKIFDDLENIKKQQKPTQKSRLTQNYIPKIRPNTHKNHCQASKDHKKYQKQFIVPVINNKNRYNKSKYVRNEYSPITDENLTNFFVTKSKKNYLNNFIQNKYQNSTSYQKDQCCFKRSGSNTKNLMTNRISTCSNPNLRSNFQDIKAEHGFENFQITNTKFLVKVIPSKKTKKFFNQSFSTLINHNYRPLTSRRPDKRSEYFIKTNEKVQYTNKIQLSKLQQRTNLKTDLSTHQNCPSVQFFNENNCKRQKQPSLDCDYFAKVNSFKKMSQNSRKNRKIKTNEIQQQKQLNFKQNKAPQTQLTSYQNGKYQKQSKKDELTNKSDILNRNNSHLVTNPNQNIFSENSSNFDFRKVNESKEIQIMVSKNFQRIKKLQKAVMSKITIVDKLGVKIPLVSFSSSKQKISRVGIR